MAKDVRPMLIDVETAIEMGHLIRQFVSVAEMSIEMNDMAKENAVALHSFANRLIRHGEDQSRWN